MAEFVRADLHGARFEGVDLAGGQLGAVDLSGAVFRGIDLTGVVMLCSLNEEWEHRLYAERDLAVLEARRP